MKVKGIVNKKVKHSQTLYKVKFKGDRPDEWKKADELDAELIQLFEDKRKAHREKKRARESGTQVAEEAAPPAKAARVKEEPKPKPDQPKSAEELKAAVVRVMAAADIDDLTKKKIRRLAESELGLAELSLDERKAEVNEAVDEYLAQQAQEAEAEAQPADDGEAGGDDSGSESESESSDSSSSEEEAEAAPVKKPLVTIKTKSGAEPPKQVAKLQADAMSGRKFEKDAELLEVDVLGNACSAEARTFSSGVRSHPLPLFTIPLPQLTCEAGFAEPRLVRGRED